MFVRIFTVKFHVATECFDDQEVQEFIKDKEVLSIREHFFVKHETPYLVLIVTYLPGASPPSRPRRNTKAAWRESISNEQLLHLFINSSPLCENMRLGKRSRHRERSRTIAPGPSTECILSPSTLLRIHSVEGLRVTHNTVDLSIYIPFRECGPVAFQTPGCLPWANIWTPFGGGCLP